MGRPSRSAPITCGSGPAIAARAECPDTRGSHPRSLAGWTARSADPDGRGAACLGARRRPSRSRRGGARRGPAADGGGHRPAARRGAPGRRSAAPDAAARPELRAGWVPGSRAIELVEGAWIPPSAPAASANDPRSSAGWARPAAPPWRCRTTGACGAVRSAPADCIVHTGLAALNEQCFAGLDRAPLVRRVPGRERVGSPEGMRATVPEGLGAGMVPTRLPAEEIERGRPRRGLAEFEPPPLPIRAVIPSGRMVPARPRALTVSAAPPSASAAAPAPRPFGAGSGARARSLGWGPSGGSLLPRRTRDPASPTHRIALHAAGVGRGAQAQSVRPALARARRQAALRPQPADLHLMPSLA